MFGYLQVVLQAAVYIIVSEITEIEVASTYNIVFELKVVSSN